MPLGSEKLAEAAAALLQSGQEALFLIEYDVSVVGERAHACTRERARPHVRVPLGRLCSGANNGSATGPGGRSKVQLA